MNVSTDEVAAVWPLLGDETRLAVYAKVLECRLDRAERDMGAQAALIERLEHQIKVLEDAVKQPALNYDGVKVA